MRIESEQLWNISGYQNLIEKAEEIIKGAKSVLYISAWRSEILELEDMIREADNRGVKVVMFSFTELPKIGQVYSYDLREDDLEKVWNHKMVLVKDHQELVMGEVNKKQQNKAAWTMNKAIVEIAENYIILDITLFGIRAKVDIGQAVIEKKAGELFLLNELLQDRFPDNPVVNMDFSQYSIKENNKVH
jgi:sugar-specific transcriptional regulator TrmB